ncbi:MAG: hypothetical protein ACOY5C_07085 [Pseudomonadota bacterium]|uniref:hypothetical protein n=1 Tax=Thermithiobacillus tepidarius TaxID=929 RepID=UPI0012DD784C|nr:hypothetical protein [Thermithiobacillus tepidarius]
MSISLFRLSMLAKWIGKIQGTQRLWFTRVPRRRVSSDMARRLATHHFRLSLASVETLLEAWGSA